MSKYRSGFVAASVLAVTAGLGAQGQNPANTPPPDASAPAGVQRAPAPPSAQTRTETVTISGCLQNAPAMAARGAAAGSGSASPSPAAGAATRPQFILSSAAVSSAAKPGEAVGTAGSAATTYQLQGDATMLSPHLDHKVEITGAIQSSSASATGAANAAPGSTAAGPTLRVESVKMLTATCDAGSTKAPAPAAPAAPPQP
jgi:hypothetical protein